MDIYQNLMNPAVLGKKSDAGPKERKMTFFEFCSLFAIFIYSSWQALSGFLLHIDGAGRFSYVAVIMAFLVCQFIYTKDLLKYKKPLLIWGLWSIYTIVNILFQGVSAVFFDNVLDMLLKIGSKWMFLAVLLTMFSRLPKKTVLTILASLLCSCVLYTFYGEWTVTGRGYERFYSEVINANEIAYIALIQIFLLQYSMIVFQKKTIVKCGMQQIIVYASLLIFQTACRTAVICLLILFVIMLWSFLRKRYSSRVSFIFCIILFISSYSLISNLVVDTTVGQRFINREEDVSYRYNEDSLIVKMLGERSGYVFEGFEIWQDAKWFGVGYGNYIYYSHSEHRNHVEYMSQLSENGLFGFLIYLFFLFVIYQKSVGSLFKKDLLSGKNVLLYGGFQTLLIFNVGLFTSLQNTFYILAACLLTRFGDKNEAGTSDNNNSSTENKTEEVAADCLQKKEI